MSDKPPSGEEVRDYCGALSRKFVKDMEDYIGCGARFAGVTILVPLENGEPVEDAFLLNSNGNTEQVRLLMNAALELLDNSTAERHKRNS